MASVACLGFSIFKQLHRTGRASCLFATYTRNNNRCRFIGIFESIFVKHNLNSNLQIIAHKLLQNLSNVSNRWIFFTLASYVHTTNEIVHFPMTHVIKVNCQVDIELRSSRSLLRNKSSTSLYEKLNSFRQVFKGEKRQNRVVANNMIHAPVLTRNHHPTILFESFRCHQMAQ